METISSRLQAGLQFIVSTNQWGVHAIRIAIFIIFIWIGGLKFWNYEAEGIVPFVANSPFMNFFYEKKGPFFLSLSIIPFIISSISKSYNAIMFSSLQFT